MGQKTCQPKFTAQHTMRNSNKVHTDAATDYVARPTNSSPSHSSAEENDQLAVQVLRPPAIVGSLPLFDPPQRFLQRETWVLQVLDPQHLPGHTGLQTLISSPQTCSTELPTPPVRRPCEHCASPARSVNSITLCLSRSPIFTASWLSTSMKLPAHS